jgi:uncharacterized SAM-binding protein YcdF (DUF218 family)
MFFVVSKILAVFTWPSNLLLMLGFVGAVLLATRFTRAGLLCLLASILLLATFSLPSVANALILPLEQRFPPWDSARGAPDGIIVLGGGFSLHSNERITSAVELARKYPNARLVFSGGNSQILSTGNTEADSAKRLFEKLGFSVGRLITEDRSRNTDENAKFAKAIADPKLGKRWLLVTSAHHMPRAVGAFRRAGFPVEAYPVERTGGDFAQPLQTALYALALSNTAVHEWIALFVYWLTGRSSELFPRP